MSAPRPPRRVSPAVYRRRRLVFGVAALAIVLSIVLLIVRPGASTPTVTPSPTPTGLLPTATATASPTPTVAKIDVSKLSPCDSGDMTIKPMVDGATVQSYGTTAKPMLSFSITYNGLKDCYYNVGTNTQVFTIKSGAETYWKSTDCQSGASETLAIFKPGQTETSAPFAWNRVLSPSREGGTCDANSAAAPRPASYSLVVEVGNANSDSSAQIVLN